MAKKLLERRQQMAVKGGFLICRQFFANNFLAKWMLIVIIYVDV